MHSPEMSSSRPDPLQRTKEEREAALAEDLGPVSGSSAEADDEEEELISKQAGAPRLPKRAREARGPHSAAVGWHEVAYRVLVVLSILIVGLAIVTLFRKIEQPSQSTPPDTTHAASSSLHQLDQVLRSERSGHQRQTSARLSQLGSSLNRMHNKRKLGVGHEVQPLVASENAAVAVMHTGRLQPA